MTRHGTCQNVFQCQQLIHLSQERMQIKPFLLQYEYLAHISMAGHKRTMEKQNDLLVKEKS